MGLMAFTPRVFVLEPMVSHYGALNPVRMFIRLVQTGVMLSAPSFVGLSMAVWGLNSKSYYAMGIHPIFLGRPGF